MRRILRQRLEPLLFLALVFGCSESADSDWEPGRPRAGESRFYSADATPGTAPPTTGDDGDFDAGAPAGEAGGDKDGERSVEEGDVYRALGGGRLLNLNAYRGLQVIDLSDLRAPRIVGRLPVTGTPVELYVSGDRAYVLLNDWRGYWGSRDDVTVEMRSGGLVLSVDISDPTAPRVVDRALVPGRIYRSRLARGDGHEALYVVGQFYGEADDGLGGKQWTTLTKVNSYQLGADGRLQPASELSLGGWVTDIAATPRALLVARTDWYDGHNRVQLVDISSPAGTMVAGADVEVAGMVRNQFNMDLRGNVLRVVSGRTWNGKDNANHLQTFDATLLDDIQPIDHDTFGENEDLFATLFLDEAAFFVTYFRTDPFHAFSIDETGNAEERSEFIVSGWNDYFRAVSSETRLIGIGMNDQAGGRRAAVSLYDITDLTNPEPLIQRAEVDADWTWSEAQWDHRAFSVIENAVSVPSESGVEETGLVLLPFSSYDASSGGYQYRVQIFTFSDSTLTRRGVMENDDAVRRSFLVEGATANLSEAQLSLYSREDPDLPERLGSVTLAPNYTELFSFGSHRARVSAASNYYSSWYGNTGTLTVDVIAADQPADSAPALASFEVPAGMQLAKVGDKLVAVGRQHLGSGAETTILSWDLSEPTSPRPLQPFVTRDIPVDGGYIWTDCFDCGGYYATTTMQAVGDALVFPTRKHETKELGTERVCTRWPEDYGSCGSAWTDGCTRYTGYERCVTRDGKRSCDGTLQECVYRTETGTQCRPIDSKDVPLEETCQDRPWIRSWQRLDFHVVDLRDPAHAQVRHIESAKEDEALGLLVSGSDLWVSYQLPQNLPYDPRPWVRIYARRISLENPAAPRVYDGVNVPGQLLAVEGSTLFTRDRVWGNDRVVAAVAKLRLVGSSAVLLAHQRFDDSVVREVRPDGAGQVLVSHRKLYPESWSAENEKLTVLDARHGLEPLGTTEVDAWAELADARSGRALYRVPGGLMVFNLDDPRRPRAQAYFPTLGWPRQIAVEGRTISIAAGRYGIYEFDLDEWNLLED